MLYDQVSSLAHGGRTAEGSFYLPLYPEFLKNRYRIIIIQFYNRLLIRCNFMHIILYLFIKRFVIYVDSGKGIVKNIPKDGRCPVELYQHLGWMRRSLDLIAHYRPFVQ